MLAFHQAKAGSLEKDLHAMRESELALKVQFSSAQQELSLASERADKAEAAKADLIKLVDEVGC